MCVMLLETAGWSRAGEIGERGLRWVRWLLEVVEMS